MLIQTLSSSSAVKERSPVTRLWTRAPFFGLDFSGLPPLIKISQLYISYSLYSDDHFHWELA